MYSWGNTRRFNAYVNYLKSRFGSRIQKLSVDAGFTCPNRDGIVGLEGCTYCNNDAFNPSYCTTDKSITQQLQEGIEFHANRYRRADGYLAFFQTFSNTYAPIEKLKTLYNEALSVPGVIGLIISTRPDCIDDEKLDYIAELAKQYYVVIEYGIESCYDKTLDRINRGHNFAKAVETIEATAKRGIHIGTHLILGLPGESRAEMLDEASILSSLPINSLKLHQLQIVRDTMMEKDFADNPNDYSLFELPEYVDFVVDFLERLSPSIYIERLTAEVPPRFLIAPNWGLIRMDQVLQRIEKRMEERDTWQGKFFVE